jgi:hypothetical protein
MRKGHQPIEPLAEDVSNLHIFRYVDAIEALNGANTPRENVLALQVAQILGKPVTGGSDCHSNHGIGYYCTIFEDSIETPEAMLLALKRGRFRAGHGLAAGKLTPFTETSLEDVAAG